MKEQKKDITSNRVLFFSDAVFAIAITLLALDIRLPSTVDLKSESSVLHAISSLGPHYLAFMVSFFIIGRLWAGHVRKYSGGIRIDRTFMSLNLLMLMVVAFMPFPTNVFSVSSTKTATIFYSVTMIIVGLLYSLMWWHAAIKHNNVTLTPEIKDVKKELVGSLLICAVFTVSAGIALIDANLARWSWLLFIPAFKWIS